MTIHELLKHYWGHDSFRPLQEEIIQAVIKGQDTLALLPTGGGKSICFQIPALLQDGVCLVVTPLIALMKDQVYNLRKKNIEAVAIYAGMTNREIERVLDNCTYGNIKFLYLSPERLQTPLFQERLKKIKVNLIAVDEAHCISQWGFDFRPAYRKIAELRTQLPGVAVLAVTATATERVKLDIQEQLAFPHRNIFQKSFARANLSYSLFREENKHKKLLQILRNVKGCGIIYVRSRRKTKDIADFLRRNNISADFYHAGLTTKTRTKKQKAWLYNQTRIMVCTNAFGMGIDKADVRVVVHFDLPESIEAYYQEAGRCGRDERKAYAVILYDENDHEYLVKNIAATIPTTETLKQTYQALANYYQIAIGSGAGQSFDFDLLKFCKTYNLSVMPVYHALKVLEQDNYIHLSDALYNPSRLLMRVTKETLYRFEVANRRLEPYLKTILRTYGGVFDDYVKINEAKIASILNTATKYVQEALALLHKKQIIDYVPQSEQPKLTFTQARLPKDHLLLNQDLLTFRKTVKEQQVQAMIAYTKNTAVCRSQQLVTYFGEVDSNPCGVCDVCLKRKKAGIGENQLTQISQKIKQVLTNKSLNVSELLLLLPFFKEDAILKIIRWMLDNQVLLMDEEGKLSKSSSIKTE